MNDDFKIIRKVNKIDFWYKGEFYIYETRLGPGADDKHTEIIIKNDELIFTLGTKNSNEAELVYTLIKSKI